MNGNGKPGTLFTPAEQWAPGYPSRRRLNAGGSGLPWVCGTSLSGPWQCGLDGRRRIAGSGSSSDRSVPLPPSRCPPPAGCRPLGGASWRRNDTSQTSLTRHCQRETHSTRRQNIACCLCLYFLTSPLAIQLLYSKLNRTHTTSMCDSMMILGRRYVVCILSP